MLETILKVGAPSPLPTAEAGQDGAGTLCSFGIQAGNLGGPYKYLPFAKGGINYVASQGQDVLSYNFTGCIMAVFTEGGVQKVCHVSTGDGQDCLAEWANIKARSTNVFEFKPHEYISTGGGAFMGCYGLITADLRMYAITVIQNRVAGGHVASSDAKIAAITMARPMR